ncbi:S8 family peptidase [Marinirhabdus gelatinilytica]|uniref:Subtilase family protein n=1 Tax=Marinirhabdus gelatinilytica TaxID=1703343 RepID=A0A370Q4L6_9FLAO|nr:S8 family serine peptidase [Marinirhabdus gelatinilytica]RDK83229.1 subtilase family protein [Marinirhabdus gelatinilytica]
MKSIHIFFIICCLGFSATAQQYDKPWFYIRAADTLIEPQFERVGEVLKYSGTNRKMRRFFENHTIYEFKKTYRKATRKNLKKTFFVIAESESFKEELLDGLPRLFVFGETILGEDKKIFEPNDYGLTSTIGENLGEPIILDYLDYLKAPEAWYYTVGERDVIIGISDGRVDTIDPDFKGKTKIIKKSSIADGHGYSSSANAAAQGNNAHGTVGVCYNCSVYGTSYIDLSKLSYLKELSDMGVRIINCSWATTRRYDTAQEIINEMWDNGTIVIASSGNKKWKDTKGKVYHYPASYDHVISVGSVMYRNETWHGNLKVGQTNRYYGENIRHYLGRTMGFRNNDTLTKPIIWPISIPTLNTDVDLLTPTVGLFRYSRYLLEDYKLMYSEYATTSGAAPLVSGTIGLMLSLVPCLPVEEIEPILKMASTNIDYVEENKPYQGRYGAGALSTGNTIKLLYDLYTEDATSTIQNQDFSRWKFTVRSFSERTVIKNQKFRDSSQLKLKAKNKVVIQSGTVLKPNKEGYIRITIAPELKRDCDLRFRDPSLFEEE